MERKDGVSESAPELTLMFRGLDERRLRVAGEQISVAHSLTHLPEYVGPPPTSTWRKPIVGPPERPFAELQVVQRLEADGWTAAWVHRPGQFLRTWEPREHVSFPKKAQALLERIQKRVGSPSGTWDVFAWRNAKPRFIELKRTGSSDRLRSTQVAWRKAALKEGVPSSAFEILEWHGGSLTNRVLRLTSYTYDRESGWVEYRKGALHYGGASPDGTRAMVEFYRGQVDGTDADLLWFTFVRNSSGITWCGIAESPDRPSRSQR